MERIAIVGSRAYADLERVKRFVASLPPGTEIVSGGAPGVDRAAEQAAKAHGLKTYIYPAEWSKHGNGAGFRRNHDIVAAADRVVAFWDGKSNGTQHTIRIAKEQNKPVEIIPPMLRVYGGEVTIYTGRISLRDPDVVDTTIKSLTIAQKVGGALPRGAIFAPTWAMVHAHKIGRATDEWYTAQYLEMMRQRYARAPQAFLDLIARPRLILTCYCAAGKFCHRHIAKDILIKIGKRYMMNVIDGGEYAGQ